MKTVGIIGGLGPETTADFYMKVIKLCKERNETRYPPIIMYSVPVPFKVEQNVVEKGKGEEEILPFLVDGVKELEQTKADFIVIPCNTVHLFIEKLRKTISTSILSIVEETAKKCENKGYQKVGILATSKTIEEELYEEALKHFNIKLLTPAPQEQNEISKIISRILNGKKLSDDKEQLLKITQNLENKGAEAIILGCTDLQLLISHKDSELKFLDSTEILAEATVDEILSDGSS